MAAHDLRTEAGLRDALAEITGRLDREVAARVQLQAELTAAQTAAAAAVAAATASSSTAAPAGSLLYVEEALGK